MPRFTEEAKHEAVRRWDAEHGRGSVLRRHKILEDVGCSATSIYNWRQKGYGKPTPVPSEKALSMSKGNGHQSDDVLDWMLVACEEVPVPEDMSRDSVYVLCDLLLAHRLKYLRSRG